MTETKTKEVKMVNLSLGKLGKIIKVFFKKLGNNVESFFKKLGAWLKDIIIKLGEKTGNWVISLRNEQIKGLKETVDNIINENNKHVMQINDAADLVLDSEIEINKLAYENKVLEDLAYKKMRETLEAQHELELFKKEKEIEKDINEHI